MKGAQTGGPEFYGGETRHFNLNTTTLQAEPAVARSKHDRS